MEPKDERAARWNRRKRKHCKDHDHVSGGFVGVRYNRNKPEDGGNRTMGRARSSRS